MNGWMDGNDLTAEYGSCMADAQFEREMEELDQLKAEHEELIAGAAKRMKGLNKRNAKARKATKQMKIDIRKLDKKRRANKVPPGLIWREVRKLYGIERRQYYNIIK